MNNIFTFSYTDKLLNLDTLLIQLREVACKWENLGKYLNFSREDIHLMKAKATNDFDCLIELCDNWIRSQTVPTWKKVADALKNIGEHELHDEFLNIYTTGNFNCSL